MAICVAPSRAPSHVVCITWAAIRTHARVHPRVIVLPFPLRLCPIFNSPQALSSSTIGKTRSQLELHERASQTAMSFGSPGARPSHPLARPLRHLEDGAKATLTEGFSFIELDVCAGDALSELGCGGRKECSFSDHDCDCRGFSVQGSVIENTAAAPCTRQSQALDLFIAE